MATARSPSSIEMGNGVPSRQGTDAGVQRLSPVRHWRRDRECEALGAAHEVDEPVNVIRQQVTPSTGQLD